MTEYYDILPGAGIGGQAGVAYIKNGTEFNIPFKEGWIKEWQTKYFTLRNGEYTDYLPAIGCRLCSEKMREVLERCKSEKDVLQWLDAKVESETGEKRNYFVLHFPVLEDVLDKKRSKYVRNILTKKVINPEACLGHEVFSYIEESSISFVVSQKAREELKKSGCRGLIYIQMTPQKKSYPQKTIRKLYRIFHKKRVQKDEKKIIQSKENINWKQIEKLNLPADLVNFISHGKTLSYDEEKCKIGRTKLVSMDSLIFGRIYVEPKEKSSKKGYYIIPAVDLIAECKGFDPWGILVWIPDIQMLGTWDSNHRILRVFHNAVWDDVVSDPIKYLNGLWNPQEVENIVYEPNDKYSFVEEA